MVGLEFIVGSLFGALLGTLVSLYAFKLRRTGSLSLNTYLDAFKKMTHSERRVWIEARKRLVSSNRYVETLLDKIPAQIAYLDLNQRLVMVNENYERWFSKSKKQLIGSHLREVIGERVYKIACEYWEQVISGQTAHFDVCAEYAPGFVRYVEGMYAPDFNSEGEIVGVLIYVQDVTSTRRAEERLREIFQENERSRSELKELADSMPQIVWMSNAEGEICFFNSRWYEYTGLAEGQTGAIGALIHEDYREYAVKVFMESLESGIPYDQEIPIRRWDGVYRWHLSRMVPVRNSDGQVVRWYGTSTDISELKEAELAFKQSEERFRLATAATDLGVWEIKEKSGEAYFCERSRGILGFPVDTCVSASNWLMHLFVEDRKLLQKKLRMIWGSVSERPVQIEFRVKREDESICWVELRAQLLIEGEQGSNRRIVGTLSDRTKQQLSMIQLKQAKEIAESASRSKTAFLANMSHEIRTPLGAILGFCQVLSRTDLQPRESKNCFDAIERNGEQLVSLLDRILDLAKVESGHIEIERIEVCLSEVIEDIVSSLKISSESQASVSIQIGTDVPSYIKTDPTRFRQILTNLVGNAMKFTRVGRVEILVTTRSKDPRQLIIDIIDSGCGMDESTQERIFQPFVQADASVTRLYGGTGLGLVLAQQLANCLSGRVQLVSSCLGKGSHFRFSLDIVKCSVINESVQSQDFDKDLVMTEGLSILVAEDARDNRYLMQMLLRRYNVKIEWASHGQEALEKALDQCFDLILMDIQMPLMDGMTATQKLRAEGYKGKIVALTAHAMREDITRCLESGFDEHLSKPINAQKLDSIILSLSRPNKMSSLPIEQATSTFYEL